MEIHWFFFIIFGAWITHFNYVSSYFIGRNSSKVLKASNQPANSDDQGLATQLVKSECLALQSKTKLKNNRVIKYSHYSMEANSNFNMYLWSENPDRNPDAQPILNIAVSKKEKSKSQYVLDIISSADIKNVTTVETPIFSSDNPIMLKIYYYTDHVDIELFAYVTQSSDLNNSTTAAPENLKNGLTEDPNNNDPNDYPPARIWLSVGVQNILMDPKAEIYRISIHGSPNVYTLYTPIDLDIDTGASSCIPTDGYIPSPSTTPTPSSDDDSGSNSSTTPAPNSDDDSGSNSSTTPAPNSHGSKSNSSTTPAPNSDDSKSNSAST